MNIEKVVIIVLLRLFDIFLICMFAYGATKEKDEPGDKISWITFGGWFVLAGLAEKFL